jgi:hypothetical protein
MRCPHGFREHPSMCSVCNPPKIEYTMKFCRRCGCSYQTREDIQTCPSGIDNHVLTTPIYWEKKR